MPALVLFLRGVNVGGHRTFRPTLLAKQLRPYDLVNIGAAGTFIVRKPGPRAAFLAELRRRLPFETDAILCDARDLLRLQDQNPFAGAPASPDTVRFVSILSKPPRPRPATPITLPPQGAWGVRLLSCTGRFVCGVYRRNMKAIAHLSRIDKLFGSPATTRNWNTITSIARILRDDAVPTMRSTTARVARKR